MFPFTRVPFWVPIFDPQPYQVSFVFQVELIFAMLRRSAGADVEGAAASVGTASSGLCATQ